MRRRLRRITITPERYFLVASAALVALTLIVFTGAAVRVTGSGLGCPDWPNCYRDGRLVAELNSHAWIEFGNRLLTTLVSITTIAAALLAFARRPFRKDPVRLGLLLPLGVVGQIVLGGLTVLYGLAPGWGMAHFLLTATILVAAAVLAWRARPAWRPGERGADLLVARLAWGMFVLGAAVLLAGTTATAAGPHAGGNGTGDLVNRLGFKGTDTLSWLVDRHGALAALLGVLSVVTWAVARRRGADAELQSRLTRLCLLMA